LPGVILAGNGYPTRRQLLVAAWLWAGIDSAIDGPDACAWYGLTLERHNVQRVHVVVPATSPCRSRDFVVVRRALADIVIGSSGLVPYVDKPTAVLVAARVAADRRHAVAVLSRALQTNLVSVASLLAAREAIGDKWCRGVDEALAAVGVGVRSPLEKRNRDLILTSRLLPEPAWNQWLDLGDGGPGVCADGLWVDAGFVEEVLGKRYHAWGEQFDDTEARRTRMIAAGLIVTGATSQQIRCRQPLLRRIEQIYALNAGRGMPPGVTLVQPPAIAQ
jgi:hypothetical protein